MNAAEQARSIEYASKIAATVGAFKGQLPDLRSDLKPWANDPDTRELIDPDSIDIGFHFPGFSRSFNCRSLLVQIRLHEVSDGETSATNAVANVVKVIGVEVVGFNHLGQQWHLSTINNWQFEGVAPPQTPAGEKIKACCRQIFQVFNPSPEA
ncbi:hypothetical protein IQ260_21395 [Leptolyngbya cf. ectocarpi LEGE 11479]|uniref:Uncharacterized protein n=1 Tax=Leptolyngbya cf. ectocarpi LEGE 11479 TaxID=1828722 RepID=A0A929FBP6_LEPEC|nr:hypothetical protein [Leptolyngbya ectocarpi]MBE9069204.1 hypothetical protein [Leptolyngbya cf. ectocarpi LEGE 11479]